MKAIMPVLDDSRKKPYYLQLYDYIKEAILKGEIRENEKLPSLRSLSRSTGLSVTTVEQSYNQLLVEGYVYSKAQSGYYVRDVFSHLSHTQTPSASELLAPQGTAESTSSPGDGSPVFHCDPDCFDFNKWKKCMNKILTEFSTSLFFESDPQGEPELRAEISRYLYMSRGVSCDPEQIIIGAGTQQITNHLATLLRKLSIEHVALEDPGYLPVRSIFRDRGFALTPVDVADDGLIIEKLPTNIRTAVYVSPSNHVPTGAVMPIGRRYELMGWAASNDSYIIEDDYDSELRLGGQPIPTMQSIDVSDRVIYMNTFTKTLASTVRISYMILPPPLLEQFYERLSFYSCSVSNFEQYTLGKFIEEGFFEKHINRLRNHYHKKRDILLGAIRESRLGDLVHISGEEAGVHFLMEIQTEKEEEEFLTCAQTQGIRLSPLSAHYHNRETERKNVYVMNYSSVQMEDTQEIVRRLERCV